jgi:electron transport complex protein RnfC
MLLRRYGTFTGGIDLPDEKDRTLAEPIRPWGRPRRLCVPLAPCGRAPAEPVVRTGQRIGAGEKLAAAPDDSAVDVFAPLDGRVKAFRSVGVAAREELVESPAVELVELSEPAFDESPQPTCDWQAAEGDDLLGRVAAGALTTFRGRPAPLIAWLRQARDHRCRTLIANVLEQEPYVTADHRTLAECGPEVIEGLAILAKAIGAHSVVLAADRRRTQHYDGSVEAAERLGISRIALPHKYPIGADTILTKVLTRRETAPGASTLAVGAAIVDAATCLAVYRWVACGRRLLGRVVTVSGPAAREPGNLWVPFGTLCADLADAGDAPLLHGGPMTGLKCDGEVVVTPATSAVLAFESLARPVPTPCIRCGWCMDHCPARLNVTALNDAFELSLVERARRLGAAACMECGVCSYVCPARLPLAQRVRQLKRRILALRRAAAKPAAERT